MSQSNRSRHTVSLIAALAVGVLAACGGNGKSSSETKGRAEIKVMLPQDLSTSDVARVHVDVSGPGIPTPVGIDLTSQSGTWQGTLIDIPAGLDRVFSATAFDAASTLLYQGQAGPMAVASGSTVSVAILLQQVNHPPPFDNVAPTIDSVVVSSNQVSPSGTITLTATAHDDNAGDTITFSWTAPAGTFSAPNAATTSWTAPSTEGTQVLQLEVKDSKGTSATVTVEISVQHSGSTGNATVTVGFNTWPSVTAMMASPSVLTTNGTSQIAAVAFDPDGDTLSFSWGSDCPGSFSGGSTRTPSFTLQGPPPSGNHCTLSVTVTDGHGGQHTGTLSLLVGPAPQVNVAPQVDSTFKSSEQAGGGEVVTVGLTAHDPESTPLTFAWAATQGVITAIRKTSTSSEIDWLAPPCLDGTAVLTATVVDAGGAATHQPFSIPPRTGASCGGLAVSGTRYSHHVLEDGSVLDVPVDLSSSTIGAWVPSADGLTYNWRPGVGQINGTFQIPNVESTPYLLQFGTAYLWATSRTLDLSGADLGRPDLGFEVEGTQLAMQIDNLSPWQPADDVQFLAANVGIGYFSGASCAYPFFPAPLDGATSLVDSIDYYYSMQACGMPPARIEASRGDMFYAAQMVDRYEDETGVEYQELRRSLKTNSLGPDAGGTLHLNGSVTQLPTIHSTLDYRASAFEALALAAHPSATLTTHLLDIGTLPAYGQFGSYVGWPDLGYASWLAGQGDLQPTLVYGNPYPGSWTQFLTAQSSARVNYSVPKADGSEATARAFSVYTYLQEILPSSSTAITPWVGPARDLRINGAVATGDLTGVGLQPLLSWTAPSTGTANYYSLRVYELFATSGGSTSRQFVASATTSQTQFRFPPGILAAGKYYYFEVSATADPTANLSRPYIGSPQYQIAMAVTGRVQP